MYILQAAWSTYNASDLCGEPATTLGWREPGWIIAANITESVHCGCFATMNCDCCRLVG